jgi:hypothetical protein
VWNPSFSQSQYAAGQGKALWQTLLRSRGDYEYNREWFGMRTAQMCDIWKAVWRSDPRLVCVLGAQAAWSFSATEALKCPYWTHGAPCSGHAIAAVGVAPYFGGAVPSAWTSQPNGGLANLFQSLYSQNDPTIPAGGSMAQQAAWVKDFISDLAPYKPPLLAAVHVLQRCRSREHVRLLGRPRIDHADDVPLSSAPSKWQATQNVISENPCWWPSCVGAIGTGQSSTVSAVPTNLHGK